MQKPTYNCDKMKSISLIFILRVRAPFSAVTLSSTEVFNFPENSLVFHAFPHFVVLPLNTKKYGETWKTKKFTAREIRNLCRGESGRDLNTNYVGLKRNSYLLGCRVYASAFHLALFRIQAFSKHE